MATALQPTTDIRGALAASLGETVPKTLVGKLAEVMMVVERIPKSGRNNFHNYDYATEADIVAAVRKELAARHVMLIPSVEDVTRESVGEKGSALTTLRMTFTFMDGDTGETLMRSWLGCGSDKDDKGIYKAMTGGEKYFLLKTFLMPTGDDPERDDKDAKAAMRGRDKATAKPDRETKKARAKLPSESGAVYIEKVVPKQSGNVEWAEVVFSTGETLVARAPQLISLCTNLAQSASAVTVQTHQNGKGKTELDGVTRWPVQGPTDAELDAEIAAKESGAF